MKTEQYLAIRRDDRFSPNSTEADRLILQSVCDEVKRIAGLADNIPMVDEAVFAQEVYRADIYISMARSEETLAKLSEMERMGSMIINAPESVGRCRRSLLDRMMRTKGFAMPPADGENGYWLKRGDASAQSKHDVVYCADITALQRAEHDFRARGISEMVMSAHVIGDLVKFYGVGSTMFRYFYPADDGMSKFGDERRNGMAHHYDFNAKALQFEVYKLAEAVGIKVYGGDAIIDSEGRYYIIDFNDWPSFARCRAEAAHAIALEVVKK